MTPYVYLDRDSGEIVEEPILDEEILRWFYLGPPERRTRHAWLASRAFSHFYGWLNNQFFSRPRIHRFIRRFALDPAEFAEPVSSYRHFNAFFERRLKPEARPIAQAPECLVSPADGKVYVFPVVDEGVTLPIKGAHEPLTALLADDADAAAFQGGAAMVVRLAPQDYHRFHFPADGSAPEARDVDGILHSVNPMAIAKVPGLFSGNRRMITHLASDAFGRIAILEVGAMTVGTIEQTYTPGRVARGQEKGTFRFGGSTVVLLFEPGRVTFDADLVAASADGIEVHVRMGTAVATAASHPRNEEQPRVESRESPC